MCVCAFVYLEANRASGPTNSRCQLRRLFINFLQHLLPSQLLECWSSERRSLSREVSYRDLISIASSCCGWPRHPSLIVLLFGRLDVAIYQEAVKQRREADIFLIFLHNINNILKWVDPEFYVLSKQELREPVHLITMRKFLLTSSGI